MVEPLNGPSLSKLPAAKPLSVVLTSSHCCELPGTGRQLNVTLARALEHDDVGWFSPAPAALTLAPVASDRQSRMKQ